MLPPSPEKPKHEFYWLTRTNRQASCNACNAVIPARERRLLFEPDPSHAKTPKQWGTVWWKYYHLRARCLAKCTEPMHFSSSGRPLVVVDVAPAPKRLRESSADRSAATEAALELFGFRMGHSSVDSDRRGWLERLSFVWASAVN